MLLVSFSIRCDAGHELDAILCSTSPRSVIEHHSAACGYNQHVFWRLA